MDDLQDYTLAEFLGEQSTNFKSGLPLVHSSESKNLPKMLSQGKIAVTACDTFKNENLAYFFHGRPSYRRFHSQPKEWQLPFVLVLKSTCLLNVRRIFPFDSGAFCSNRFPSYLNEFSIDGYELSSQGITAVDLLIDIFFGSDTDYLHGKSRPADEVVHRRNLNIRHSEIKALCAMYNRDQISADDRALAIEIQTDKDVVIKDQLLGVVMPRPYFDDKTLKSYLKSQKVLVKNYDVYPLSTESYMSTVYTEVKAIYRKLRLIDG